MTDNIEQLPVSFGRYQLFEHIGKGGMAEIFLARTKTGTGASRICAIKRVLPELNENIEFTEMLIHEARLCSNLSAANIVETFELGKIDNQYYIAMEYVDGFDLNRLLGILTRKGVPLPLEFVLFIIKEVLKGLDFAHNSVDSDGVALKIVHRDVSPTNILISAHGQVKLCDFGIARASFTTISTPKNTVEDEHIKGKAAYMAPEHAAGKDIDQRSDLFSAGIILWELLNGRRLYKSKDPEQSLKNALQSEIPPLKDTGFPEYEMLAAIVKKALAKEPDRRFGSAREFIRAIDDYLSITDLLVSELKFAAFLEKHTGDILEAGRARLHAEIKKLENSNSDADDVNRLNKNSDPFTMALIEQPSDNNSDIILKKKQVSQSVILFWIVVLIIISALMTGHFLGMI
jgi:serine/threonine-protein kinase